MILYRITVANDKILPEMWKDNRLLVWINEWKFYFTKKDIKACKEKKKAIKTTQYLEFSNLYKTIKNNWLSSDALILKYNTLVEQGLHDKIIQWLQRYIKKIKAENIAKSFILMWSTFISQERWKDDFIIMENRVGYNQKWLLPYIQNVDELKAKLIVDEVRKREKKNNKDCNEKVLQNIIASL